MNVKKHDVIIPGVNIFAPAMFFFIVYLVAVVGFFAFGAFQGRKAARAHAYLSARAAGADQHEANSLVLRLGAQSAEQNAAMMEFIKVGYEGSQSRMISHARRDGFGQ